MMRRLLIVDDEQLLLKSLQNAFRRRSRDYDVEVAPGGAEALALMQGKTFDVVLSDMRMPKMDGAAFLSEVKRLYPQAARLVLSGGSDRQSMMRALQVAHQCLSKPFDFVLLHASIERVCATGDRLANESVRALIGGLEKLPSLPQVIVDLGQAIAAQRDLGSIAEIVERDPAMSAKILQLVNSAYFGLARPVSAVSQAVVFLGAELLRALAHASHVFSCIDPGSLGNYSLDQWQRHSFAVARMAKRLLSDPKKGEAAFTAALMHDVGKIVLALKYPDRMQTLEEAALAQNCPAEVLEREWFGTSHQEAGAYLLGVWGLPSAVVETVGYHHRPAAVDASDPELLAAVHFACSVVDGRTPDLAFVAAAGLQVSHCQSVAAETP
jgi:HD-like signal output (HDOD) protein